jgi:hypothetical protein
MYSTVHRVQAADMPSLRIQFGELFHNAFHYFAGLNSAA